MSDGTCDDSWKWWCEENRRVRRQRDLLLAQRRRLAHLVEQALSGDVAADDARRQISEILMTKLE